MAASEDQEQHKAYPACGNGSHRLKGTGKTSLFFEASERSIRYLIDCLGHDSLTSLEVSDAGRFRDYLFERGMSS